MASDVAPIERLEARPIGVDPAVIEDEFARVWRETAGDDSPVRVRVMNLVAIATRADDMDRFEAAMQVLPERHPCRGILVAGSPSYDRLEATIGAHCWRSTGGRRHVCSEEVILTGGPLQDRELASAVLGLLVPELPVCVWLLGMPESDSLLRDRIVGSADRVLLDSDRAAQAERGLTQALAIEREYGVPCADLAWARTSAWRGLIAQLFDGPDGARELDLLQSIEVRGGTGRVLSDALLLGGWLISRLALAPTDVARAAGGGIAATMYDGTREVRVRVGPAEDGAKLASVRIVTRDATFSIERHAESGHLHVREDWDSGSMRRVVDAPPDDEPSLVVAALDDTHAGTLYQDTARMISELLGSSA